MRYAGLLALALFGGCVGDLSNEPFVLGTASVTGRLEGPVDPSRAWVAVVGMPDLRSTVQASGQFEIQGVTSGAVELAASSGEGRAGRTTVTLYNRRMVEVSVPLEAAATLQARVFYEGWPPDRSAATYTVSQLPAAGALTDSGRSLRVEGLPTGCWDLLVDMPGHQPGTRSVCVQSGQVAETTFFLKDADMLTNDRCSPCGASSECNSARCTSQTIGEWTTSVCAPPCAEGTCPDGYRCNADQLCELRVATCVAMDDWKRNWTCGDDADCGAQGIADGLCNNSVCTLGCAVDADCPFDAACGAGDGGRRVCGPPVNFD